jgi:ribosome-binding protein aMBF1 (putative translation factor)
MIQNQLQYRVTQSRLNEFREALTSLSQEKLPRKAIEVRRKALESLIAELEADLRAYDELQHSEMPDLSLLEDLPETLIKARIAAGLTHAALAERLGMKPQQVQRYEATKYASASLERVMEVAKAIQGR